MKSTPRVPTWGRVAPLKEWWRNLCLQISVLLVCLFSFHICYTMPALLQKVQAEILLLFANFQSIPSYIKQFCSAKAASKAHSKWADDPLSFPCTIRWSLQAWNTVIGRRYISENLKPPAWQKRLERHHQSIDSHRVCLVSSLANSGKFAKILRYGSWKVVILLGSDKLAQFLCNDQ